VNAARRLEVAAALSTHAGPPRACGDILAVEKVSREPG